MKKEKKDTRLFDSNEEKYFQWWLDDLDAAGLVESIQFQPQPFILSPHGDDKSPARLDIPWVKKKQLKTKLKREDKISRIIRTKNGNNIIYTPDFLVHWKPEAIGVVAYVKGGEYFELPPLFAQQKNGALYSYIEVKGSQYQVRQSEEATKVRIAVTHAIYGEAVQVVRPTLRLFKDTFYPQRYFLNDNQSAPRKKRSGKKMIPLRSLPESRACEEFIDDIREKNCVLLT